ncbi:PREDICTED: probable protein phosphatase 2C 74 [Camelina sativa]|uniref:Probable protein phosphatase 2C 74 n=1 Tax=Camelina sativa TaxID=90675 RepID=A0ABM0UGG0_CAMSA|nr:PREDICTED: probable protein phosphatase 2C 74 [Camelina sativa]
MGSCLSSGGGGGSSRTRRRSLHGSPHVPGPGRRRRPPKRRSRSCSSSFDNTEEPLLHRIPGRLFLNGSTDTASLFSQQGKKGPNQDAMIVWENFGSMADTVFCGVFDGHGPYGHIVAKRVRDLLPLKLGSHLESYVSCEEVLKEISLNTGDRKISENLVHISANGESRVYNKDYVKDQDMVQTLIGSIVKAYRFMDKELKMQVDVDCFCSGTTAVTMVKQGQHLVIGNIGDSRAVLGTRNKENKLVPFQLTEDLKPDVPAEAERIKRCKGRIFALRDEPGVARMWLPNHNSPGLAMARAFGDFCLKDFGLISVPDVSYRRLTEKDEFVVLATDGIWDALTNEEVIEIVAKAPTRSSAGRALVEAAVRNWRWKFPTSKVDDCAVVCLFLDSEPNSLSTASFSKEIHISNGVTEPEPDKASTSTPGSGTGSPELNGVNRIDTLVNLPVYVPTKE